MSTNVTFFAETPDGQTIRRDDPRFVETYPISTAMLDSIDADPDLGNVISAIATAIISLEALQVDPH